MSITSPDNRITEYNPVAPTAMFAAQFPVFSDDDLAVFVDDEEREDFTVQADYINGISNNANIILSVGVVGNVKVVGLRSPRRTSRFNDGGPIPTRDLNLALDTIEAEEQETSRDVRRAHKAPFGEEGAVFSAEDIGRAEEYATSARNSVDEAHGWADAAEGYAQQTANQVANVTPSVTQYAVGDTIQSIDLGNEDLVPNLIRIFIDGVYQAPDAWNLTDGVISPVGDAWPGDGVRENMTVLIDATVAAVFGVPGNGSVTVEKLAPDVIALIEGITPKDQYIYNSKTEAESDTYDLTPDRIILLGYYSAGDGGGALYVSPTTVNPVRSDTIQIVVDGAPTWYFRVHDKGAVDLLQHGLHGNGSDETTAFAGALSLAADIGLDKVVCSDRRKSFKIVELDITDSVEIDLGGATLLADFNNLYPGTCATVLSTLEEDDVSLILRNMTVDGQNDGSAGGGGAHPLLWFQGGAKIELDRVRVINGANRDKTLWPNFVDNMQGELQVKNAGIFRMYDSEIIGSPGEQVQIISSAGGEFQRTKVEIDRCYFSKARSFDPGTTWSSSSIVIYNCGNTSHLRDCTFDRHIKSAVNWFGPGVIEGCKWLGVSDSSGLDFDEVEKFGMDKIVVRDCLFQNIIGGYAIRASARQIIIENVEINRCQYGILISKADETRPPYFSGIGAEGERTLYNVWLKNITSNGNDVPDGSGAAVDNTLIRIIGDSRTVPVHVYIEGNGVQVTSNGSVPSANPEFGVWASNCYLYLTGAFMHGRTAGFNLQGFKKVVARDCQFFVNANSHLFLLDGGVVTDMVFEDCEVYGSLTAGFSHVRLVNSPTISGKLYRNRTPGISTVSAGFPFVTNYTTAGTT